MRRHRFLLIALAPFVAAGLVCASAADGFPSYRLVDHAGSRTSFGTITDGTRKRMFDPNLDENVIPLKPLPGRPVLSFAAGLRPFDRGGTVRFEIWLRPKSGPDIQLYRKELSATGWWADHVDLSSHALEGAQLVFRRILVDGPPLRLLHTAWGDPVIVPTEGPGGPSVILISLDTLRADRLGVYGHAHARTPVLDGLARAGAWYTQAYSPSAWTLPSHASLFYGRPLDAVPIMPLGTPTGAPTVDRSLAELLRDAGYLTAGFTGGGYLAHGFGFTRGFDSYYMFPQPQAKPGECLPGRFDGPEVFRRAIEWLRERGHAPFFLFLHTYDVHDRCPFRRADQATFEPWPALSAEENGRLLAHYDGLIAETDARLGTLLAALDQLGLSDSTLVVVVSDHGEFFSEHGLRGHGCAVKLYEEVVRVPLLVRYPARLAPKGPTTEPVSLLDIAPSILALLGLPRPASMQGDVLPGLSIDRRGAAQPLHIFCDQTLAVRDERYKLLTSRSGTFPDEVYDLETDPGEARNLAGTNQGLDTRLQQDAAAYWQTAPASQAQARKIENLDAETRERLRALGYQ